MEKSFFCEQAELDVNFYWNPVSVSSGLDTEAYSKVGKTKCDGMGKGKCPVNLKLEPDGRKRCLFHCRLAGKESSSTEKV